MVAGRPGARAHPAAKPLLESSATLTLVRDPLRILLFILTVVTISRVHLHYPILARLRPVLLLSAAAMGYVFLNPRQLSRVNVMNHWPMRIVALMGGLSCLSAVFGISLGASASFILDSYAKTIAYAFLIAVSIRHVRDLYTFVWAYVISCGILALFALFVFDLSTGGGYAARLDEMYTYDSNDLGLILMIGLPLNLLLLFIDKGVKRWVLFATLLGIAGAMARSGSRGGFLGLVAVGFAALFLVNGVSVTRRVSFLGATMVALLALAPPGYWKQMGTILKPEHDYNVTSNEGRTALIKRGLGYMSQYPVFGIGIWNFARAECTISSKAAERRLNGPLRCTAPHNSLIQAGSELGVPGLLAFAALVIGGVIAPLRLRRQLPRWWRRGVPAERFLYGATSFFPIAMIGFAVTSFFVSFAFADPVYLIAAFVSGLYVAVQTQLKLGAGIPAAADQAVARVAAHGWRVNRSSGRVGSLRSSWIAVS